MTTLYLPEEHFVPGSSRLRMICDIAVGLTTEHANEIGVLDTHQLENDVPARGWRTFFELPYKTFSRRQWSAEIFSMNNGAST